MSFCTFTKLAIFAGSIVVPGLRLNELTVQNKPENENYGFK
jgi:hypothetical protein